MDSTKYVLTCNGMNSGAARTESRLPEAFSFSLLLLESLLGSVGGGGGVDKHHKPC